MGKKWKNAPVMYTVAQVRFNQILTMESYVPVIQEKIRTMGFPDFRREVISVLGLSLGQPESSAPTVQTVNRYAFGDINKTSGFMLENNALSFQATDYSTFEDFIDCFLKVLSVVHESVSIAFVERIGIRYLDAVLPQHDESISTYLIPEVLGLTCKTKKDLSHSYTETVCTNPDGGLISRVIIQKAKVSLPPELGQTSYPLNPRFSGFEGLHAVIDTDGYFETRTQFDIEMIGKKIAQLHEDVVESFKLTATSHALKIWEFGSDE